MEMMGKKLDKQTLLKKLMLALAITGALLVLLSSSSGFLPGSGLDELITTRRCDFITLGGTTYFRCVDGFEGTASPAPGVFP